MSLPKVTQSGGYKDIAGSGEWVVVITHMNEETEEEPEKDRAPVDPAWCGVYPCCPNSGPAPSLFT